MIVLNESQYVKLDNDAVEDFASKVVLFIQRKHPHLADDMSQEKLHSFCKGSIIDARDKLFVLEWDACRYCWLRLVYGEEFPESLDWSRSITEHEEYSSTYKMDLLEHYHINFLQLAVPTPN